MTKQPDNSEILLKKAAEDELIVDKNIEDSQISNAVIGFHLQQASEKLLKGALAHFKIQYPYVHDLSKLNKLLHENGHTLPSAIEDLLKLTPFATTIRYDDIDPPLDRAKYRQLVSSLRAWIEAETNKAP